MNTVPPDWNQIVDEHSTRVFRVAMRILGSIPDAEDVAQEAFIEAYRLHSLREVQCWTGLLVRLATLRSLDALRRRRLTVPIANGDPASRGQPFDRLVASELEARLRQSITTLPAQQATVFTLAYYERWGRDEIAAHLGINQKSVSSSLHKARKHLANLLSMNLKSQGELP